MADAKQNWTAVLFDLDSRLIGEIELPNGAPAILQVKPKVIGRVGTIPITFRISGDLDGYISRRKLTGARMVHYGEFDLLAKGGEVGGRANIALTSH